MIVLLQKFGRALMLPIAVLPIAGLLLRLGQADLLNIPFVAAAGESIFAGLGLIFAIGVAVGFARDNNGAAGLGGAVCFLVATKGAAALSGVDPVKLSVPIGILSGAIAGVCYNRYSDFKLPDYLAFFAGRRFVPIVSGFGGLALALLFGGFWPFLTEGMDRLSLAIADGGAFSLFVYGALNRLLIITGLHHILNNVVWFLIGDYHGVTGDLKRFFAGDPTAGKFMSGFFPVMMFGLPAACLAMYRAAEPGRRAAVGGMLLSMALTAFLTGVTEPIEFTFMFLAPALYAIHVVLTGVAMALMDALGVRLGFTFSGGVIDYLINFGKATRPLLLLPVGAAYFAAYYTLFAWFIRRLDLKTPGRDAEVETPAAPQAATRGGAFIAALGGPRNLTSVDACTTRLRLTVADPKTIDEAALKALGARGVVRPSELAVQIVLGPIADAVAGEMRAHMSSPADALGGRGNFKSVALRGGRLLLEVKDRGAIDHARLEALGVKDIVIGETGLVHLITGADSAGLLQALGEE